MDVAEDEAVGVAASSSRCGASSPPAPGELEARGKWVLSLFRQSSVVDAVKAPCVHYEEQGSGVSED